MASGLIALEIVSPAMRFLFFGIRQIIWCSSISAAIGLMVLDGSFAREVPKFSGTAIPIPPKQFESWVPADNKLSQDELDAVTALFNAGLADPRGCDYRQIEVVVGTCWGNFIILKTHGWVLPGGNSEAFGICWNGLVYPLVSMGTPADLRADMQTMLKLDRSRLDEEQTRLDTSEKLRKDASERDKKDYSPVKWPLRWNAQAVSEPSSVAWDSMHPIKAALLLRVGEIELAEKVWTQWFTVEQQRHFKDSFLQLAYDWSWSFFDRAVCAHMRGDDHLALASAQALVRIQQAIEAKAEERHIPRPKNSDDSQKIQPYLPFLDQLSDLITDEERRVKELSDQRVLQAASPPPIQERIAGLIHDLELVSARQDSQPGGVDLAEDPIVAALIAIGDEAVNPLLDCLENDNRLTCSVHFGRDFFPSRTILGVSEAAYAALAGILQTRFFRSASTADSLTAHGQEGRKKVTDQIRAYWQKYKGQSLEDRWYNVLSDDAATPRQWLEAAENIVRDADVTVSRSSMFGGWSTFTNQQPGIVPPMRGESLRTKVNPGVSDLLVKRMKDLSVPMNQTPDINLEMKVRFALALAKWDGKNHIQDLRSLSDVLKSKISMPGQSHDNVISALMAVYKARIRTGDPQSLSDYAGWMGSLPLTGFDFASLKIFEIMWQHPNELAVRKAAQKIFADKDSAWIPLISKHGLIQSLCHSPLVGMPAFRTKLLRGLNDRSRAGSLVLQPDAGKSFNIQVDGGWSGGGGSYLQDPLAPPVETLVYFRTCDLYANGISSLPGAPKCQLYWPEEKRDAAIAECIRFLKKYGNIYRYQQDDPNETDIFDKQVVHFPQLDHPATLEDVENTRAIFSLNGKRRLWKMPAFPMTASWTTLKDSPAMGFWADENGQSGSTVVYNTEGKVFQAEEVLIDGKWKRFFGYVGPYHISKVPAEEMEFPSGRMGGLSHQFESEIIVSLKSQKNRNTAETQFELNNALPFTLKVRNCSGLDQSVSGSVIQSSKDAGKLPHAVELKLAYTNKTGREKDFLPESEWQTVPLKNTVSVAEAGANGPTLAPTQEFAVMAGDLRDFFDLIHPGTYRVEAKFNDPDWATGKTLKTSFVIYDK